MFSRFRHAVAAVFVLFLIPVCVRAQVAIVVKPVQVNYIQYEDLSHLPRPGRPHHRL